MFEILFETDANSATGVFDTLDARMQDTGLIEFMEDHVDPYLRRRIANRFLAEGDDVSGHWHPLTRATELIRARQGFPPQHPINVRTRQMKDFLISTPSQVRSSGPEVILTHPPPIASGEINRKIATAQGGKANPPTPARPVIGVNENDLLYITSSLTAYLIRGIA